MSEKLVYVGDLKRLYRMNRRRLFFFGASITIIVGVLLCLREPKYHLSASFKEAMTKESTSSSLITSLIRESSSSNLSASAISIMSSRFLLEEAGKKLGLQVKMMQLSLGEKILSRLTENLLTEIGLRVSDQPEFIWRDVRYLGEKRIVLPLKMISQKEFILGNERGKVGVPITSYGFTGTLVSAPIFQKECQVKIFPTEEMVKKIRSRLRIKASKKDLSMIDLHYFSRNRYQGMEFLNHLMGIYKKYLRNENERVASAQLSFLNTRQEELTSRFDHMLKDHADYLKQNIGDRGFVGLNQEVISLRGRKKELEEKVFEVELEEKEWQEESSPFGQRSQEKKREMVGLKKQRDALDLSILFRRPKKRRLSPRFNEDHTAKLLEKLDTMEWEEVASLEGDHEELDRIKRIAQFPRFISLDSLLNEKREHLTALKQGIAALEKEKSSFPNLGHYIDMMRLKKDTYEKNLFAHAASFADFEGIDLETARKLHLEYSQEMNRSGIRKKQLLHVLHEMKKEEFEISSLCTVLDDPISHKLIQEAVQIKGTLADLETITTKEELRYQVQLARSSESLKQHTLQLVKLTHCQLGMLQEKMERLQEVMVDLLNQDIALVEKQLQEEKRQRLSQLSKEKQYIKDKIQENQSAMQLIPERWLRENMLNVKSELNLGMIEGMSKLVESKNAEHHLRQIESKPIDIAYLPIKPQRGFYLIIALFCGVLSMAAHFGILLFRRMDRGLPVSFETLKELGENVLGKIDLSRISDHLETDEEMLEIVRKGLNTSDDHLAIIGSGAQKIGHLVAQLVALEENSVLLVDSTFCESSKHGLWEYLDKEKGPCPIQKLGGYDLVEMGSSSRYGRETLRQKRFIEFIEKQEESYDRIILATSASSISSEAACFKDFAPNLMIIIENETLHDISDYLIWKNGTGKSLSFLCANGM